MSKIEWEFTIPVISDWLSKAKNTQSAYSTLLLHLIEAQRKQAEFLSDIVDILSAEYGVIFSKEEDDQPK